MGNLEIGLILHVSKSRHLLHGHTLDAPTYLGGHVDTVPTQLHLVAITTTNPGLPYNVLWGTEFTSWGCSAPLTTSLTGSDWSGLRRWSGDVPQITQRAGGRENDA